MVGIGWQELAILGGLCCTAVIGGTAVITLVILAAKRSAKDDSGEMR